MYSQKPNLYSTQHETTVQETSEIEGTYPRMENRSQGEFQDATGDRNHQNASYYYLPTNPAISHGKRGISSSVQSFHSSKLFSPREERDCRMYPYVNRAKTKTDNQWQWQSLHQMLPRTSTDTPVSMLPGAPAHSLTCYCTHNTHPQSRPKTRLPPSHSLHSHAPSPYIPRS